ncbi:TRAP transporter small permease [Arenibacterium halophilum]|uniref:TRAP transporter small permease protein n=1 Tax=Arenibacterium halophilum TaxID=2583821 RepID=A0ABY2X030_9RHOB|nr:TRAP transporter small permease subunit [Arenibacterium halophilum]TMV08279.1 TRAP transporter small permease [Arenibacterium halophilum]
MRPVETVLRRVEDVLHILGCAALVVIAVLINLDILLRVLLGRALEMQFELTEFYLMPALATLSLAWVYRQGGHLALEVDLSRIFGSARDIVRRLVQALAAAFFLIVCYVSGKYCLNAFLNDDVNFGVYDWPLGWSYLPVPLGTGVLALRLMHDMTRRGAEKRPEPT